MRRGRAITNLAPITLGALCLLEALPVGAQTTLANTSDGGLARATPRSVVLPQRCLGIPREGFRVTYSAANRTAAEPTEPVYEDFQTSEALEGPEVGFSRPRARWTDRLLFAGSPD